MDRADELRAIITEIVGPMLKKRETASVTVAAVSRNARAVLAFGPGSNGSTPPGDQFYEIGSITKVLTTSLLADLVRTGDLSLDDPVQRFLPSRADALPRRNGHHTQMVLSLPDRQFLLAAETKKNPHRK